MIRARGEAGGGTAGGRAVFGTSIGWVRATASEAGVTRIELPGGKAGGPGFVVGRGKAREHLELLGTELRAYLKGELKRFTVAVDLEGAPAFRARALRAARGIGFGKVRTYGEIARLLGKPGAGRAVGQAMARNPVPIVVPCHRVVASDGLGGYGGGLELKKRLLTLEAQGAGRAGEGRGRLARKRVAG